MKMFLFALLAVSAVFIGFKANAQEKKMVNKNEKALLKRLDLKFTLTCKLIINNLRGIQYENIIIFAFCGFSNFYRI